MPRFSELSAVPTAMPLTGEPQSAMTPRQADLPQSQRWAVPSLEQERTFLPRSTMAVSKIPASKQRMRSDSVEGRQTKHLISQGELNYEPQITVPSVSTVTHSQIVWGTVWGREPQDLGGGVRGRQQLPANHTEWKPLPGTKARCYQ